MNISIKGTNLDLSEEMKKYVYDKIGNLKKYLDGIIDIKVELEKDRHHQTGGVLRAEVMIFVKNKVIRADASSDDIYASIDLVIPKLKEQIAKYKEKKRTLVRRGARSAKKTY